MISSPTRFSVVLLSLIAFTASAAEVRRPSLAEPTQVPLVIGGVSLGLAAASGAVVLGNALQHAGGCSAGAAFAPLLGGGGGCDSFVAGPLGVIALSSLALAGAMFLVQFVLSTPPPARHASLTDSEDRRALLPAAAKPTARTDVGWGFAF